jgi:trigger factor
MKIEEKTDSIIYTYTVEPDFMMHSLEHAYNHVKQDIEIKGFRKGQVPFKKYLQLNERGLYQDAIEHILNHVIQDIYEENKEDFENKFTGQPVPGVEESTISSVVPFDITITIPLKPKVYGSDYKGIQVEVKKVEVSDDDVLNDLKKQLSQNQELQLKPNQVIESGDTVTFDFAGYLNGELFEGGSAENYELEIGSHQFIPGFEEQMIGLKSEEKKDVNVVFPEDYQQKTLAGQPVVFKVVIHEIKNKAAVELTDELILTLNKNGETKDVSQIKADIKEKLTQDIIEQNENKVSDTIYNKLLENFEVVYHESLEYDEIERITEDAQEQAKKYNIDFPMFLQLSGLTEESFNANAKQQASFRVKIESILKHVAKEENVEASESDIENEFEKAKGYYSQEIIDKHREQIRLNAIDIIIQRKAFELIKNNVVLTTI